MTNLLRQRIDRTRQELEAGNRPGEIATRLAAEWNVSTRTVERMMQVAREELQEVWKMEQEIIIQKRLEKAAEREEQRLRKEEAIEDALMDIVTGKARVNKDFRNQGRWSAWDVAPDFDQIIKAAEAYRRREAKRMDNGQLTIENERKLMVETGGLKVKKELENARLPEGQEEWTIENERELMAEIEKCTVKKEIEEENYQPQTNFNSPQSPSKPEKSEKERANNLRTNNYGPPIENEDDDTMSWYRHPEEDIRKLEEFEKHRAYESLTPEEVDWMMTEIKGYWPNLPIAISLEEPVIRERVFAKRRAEKKRIAELAEEMKKTENEVKESRVGNREEMG